MSVTLSELEHHVRQEKRWARMLSAVLKVALAISSLEDAAKEQAPDDERWPDVVETIEAERDRLRTIAAMYGRG